MNKNIFFIALVLIAGTFSGVDDIRQEIARVNATGNKLEALEMTVQEHITAQNPH